MSDKAMVAVCDILGFSNLVKSCSLKELVDFHIPNINTIMKSSINLFGENFKSPTPKEIFQNGLVGHEVISDTIIIFSLSDERDGYRNVLNAIYGLISIPMFTPIYKYRSGISYGEFYHNTREKICAGRALVEASELEKSQQWSGASLTEAATDKFIDKQHKKPNKKRIFIYPESEILIDYDVPVKNSSTIKLTVINWTRAGHNKIRNKQNWMYREENGRKVNSYSNKDVEQKILNTEKFHFYICTQCRSARAVNNHEYRSTNIREIGQGSKNTIKGRKPFSHRPDRILGKNR